MVKSKSRDLFLLTDDEVELTALSDLVLASILSELITNGHFQVHAPKFHDESNLFFTLLIAQLFICDQHHIDNLIMTDTLLQLVKVARDSFSPS